MCGFFKNSCDYSKFVPYIKRIWKTAWSKWKTAYVFPFWSVVIGQFRLFYLITSVM